MRHNVNVAWQNAVVKELNVTAWNLFLVVGSFCKHLICCSDGWLGQGRAGQGFSHAGKE